MNHRRVLVGALLAGMVFASAWTSHAAMLSENEYAKHFGALTKLSVAVAEAMPASDYAFRPDPGSMTFGELMSHIAVTNYAFCAGLKDAAAPQTPSPTDKDGIVKLLSGSFEYCTAVVDGMTEEQMAKAHDSPDGRMPGREVLLAMYIHVAHHRGQAEIYLRDKGIKPPSYRI
jgi:uncharacterized damage-inducible protein DinB